jgi:hypothetical protein
MGRIPFWKECEFSKTFTAFTADVDGYQGVEETLWAGGGQGWLVCRLLYYPI